MELSRDRRLVRWAFLSMTDDRKDQKLQFGCSLCELFWRAVLVTPMFCVTAGVLLVAFSPFILPAYLWTEKGGRERYNRARSRWLGPRRARIEPSWWDVLSDGAMAVKGKVCPLVRFVDTRETVGNSDDF